jgi:hypothetical protein
MLCIFPDSVKVTGMATRLLNDADEPYTVVLPRVRLVPEAACVTVTIWLVTPVPAMVTVAVRELAPVFAEFAVTVIVPLFEPDTGDTSSQLALSRILQVVLEVMANVPVDPEVDPSEMLDGDTVNVGITAEVKLQYNEYLKFSKAAVPNVPGIPPDHVAVESALAGVPAMYLMPGLDSNTNDSQTVCPEVTDTGLVRDTVCQPAVPLITVAAVVPSNVEGVPAKSE